MVYERLKYLVKAFKVSVTTIFEEFQRDENNENIKPALFWPMLTQCSIFMPLKNIGKYLDI